MKWVHCTISNVKELQLIKEILEKEKCLLHALDTETDGLFITINKPFLFQFGFLAQAEGKFTEGFTFAADLRESFGNRVLTFWEEEVLPKAKYVLGSNILFDMHMLQNDGRLNVEALLESGKLVDLQCLVRCGLAAIPVQSGGPPLELEKLAAYLGIKAPAEYKKLLTQERSSIMKQANAALKACVSPEAYELCEKVGFSLEMLEGTDRAAYVNWKAHLPKGIRQNALVSTGRVRNDKKTGEGIPYNLVSKGTLVRYGHQDIELTLRVAAKLLHSALHMNKETFELERKVMPIVWRMDRQALYIDSEKLHALGKAVLTELRNTQQKLEELTGCAPSRTAAMLAQLRTYEPDLPSTDQVALRPIMAGLDARVREALELLWHYRNLLKTYTKDICGLKRWGREWYPQTSPYSPVTGRFSSPAQQFPREPTTDMEGNPLFHARSLFVPREGYLSFFLDYSQLESRLQLLNTICYGTPSTSYMRAYMPYELKDAKGKTYDPVNSDDKRSLVLGKEWYHSDGSVWSPFDLHSETAKTAYGLTGEEADFKHYRTAAKTTSFAISYGAGMNRLRALFPERSASEIKDIFDAFYAARGGFRDYVAYCKKVGASARPAEEIVGHRRFDGANGHALINYLTQGAAASWLKIKLVELAPYLKEHGLADRLYLTVHDELQIYLTEDEANVHIPQIVYILEECENCPVPIVCDVEYTCTNWAEKQEYSFERRSI